jgi:hypothetical protein
MGRAVDVQQDKLGMAGPQEVASCPDEVGLTVLGVLPYSHI